MVGHSERSGSSGPSSGCSITTKQKCSSDRVSTEDYGLPRLSMEQSLTPLDMNLYRLYGARWILCFPLPAGADHSQVFDNLRVGLAHTIQSIPWIAGNIGPERNSNPEANRIKIEDSPSGVMFRFKDLVSEIPSYEELKSQSFPPRYLETANISPVGVMPDPTAPAAVFAAQANFVEGGLLLAVTIHHSAGDAVALNCILDAWAQNVAAVTNNDPSGFSSYDSQSNDRSVLMKGTVPADMKEFPEYILHPTPKITVSTEARAQEQVFQMPPMVLHLFRFSPASLGDLKIRAAAYSTNDALCAFLWRHMTLARQSAGSGAATSPDATTAFAYSVNIRHRTSPPLSPMYMGNASMLGMTGRLSASSLTAQEGTASAAAAIRASLGRFKSPTRVPETIGLLGSREDPTDFKLAYNAFLGPDVIATSWADIGVYGTSWGALGNPESLRTPGDGADGTVTILPRLADGGIEVLVGLECGAMERMLANEEFGRFAELWS